MEVSTQNCKCPWLLIGDLNEVTRNDENLEEEIYGGKIFI